MSSTVNAFASNLDVGPPVPDSVFLSEIPIGSSIALSRGISVKGEDSDRDVLCWGKLIEPPATFRFQEFVLKFRDGSPLLQICVKGRYLSGKIIGQTLVPELEKSSNGTYVLSEPAQPNIGACTLQDDPRIYGDAKDQTIFKIPAGHLFTVRAREYASSADQSRMILKNHNYISNTEIISNTPVRDVRTLVPSLDCNSNDTHPRKLSVGDLKKITGGLIEVRQPVKK